MNNSLHKAEARHLVTFPPWTAENSREIHHLNNADPWWSVASFKAVSSVQEKGYAALKNHFLQVAEGGRKRSPRGHVLKQMNSLSQLVG